MQIRRPGAKALVVSNGRFVMVQRDNNPNILNPNKWNLPGGAIEAGETPKEALLRELKEEINIAPSAIEEMGTTTYTDGGSIVYRFVARLTPEERDQVQLISEGQQLDWFTRTEALTLDLSAHLRAYLTECGDAIDKTLMGTTVAQNWTCKASVTQ